jgi:hypothetical protein
MKRSGIEIDKHHMMFDIPHVYICSCGFKAYVFPTKTVVMETPKVPIVYLPCGHATCAKIEDEKGKSLCIICGKPVLE